MGSQCIGFRFYMTVTMNEHIYIFIWFLFFHCPRLLRLRDGVKKRCWNCSSKTRNLSENFVRVKYFQTQNFIWTLKCSRRGAIFLPDESLSQMRLFNQLAFKSEVETKVLKGEFYRTQQKKLPPFCWDDDFLGTFSILNRMRRQSSYSIGLTWDSNLIKKKSRKYIPSVKSRHT